MLLYIATTTRAQCSFEVIGGGGGSGDLSAPPPLSPFWIYIHHPSMLYTEPDQHFLLRSRDMGNESHSQKTFATS